MGIQPVKKPSSIIYDSHPPAIDYNSAKSFDPFQILRRMETPFSFLLPLPSLPLHPLVQQRLFQGKAFAKSPRDQCVNSRARYVSKGHSNVCLCWQSSLLSAPLYVYSQSLGFPQKTSSKREGTEELSNACGRTQVLSPLIGCLYPMGGCPVQSA